MWRKGNPHTLLVGILNGQLGFPGGAVVKNLPTNARDIGLSPGPGRFHMLRSS